MAITKVTRTLLSTGIDDQSNATAITIDSSENVGIGTTSPDTLLHLNAVQAGAVLRLSRQDGSVVANDSYGKIEFYTNDVTSTGVGGYIDVQAESGAAYSSMIFGTGQAGSADEKVRISSNGNVGIGTSSPSSELHIKGASPAGIFNSQLLVDTTDTTGAENTGSKILFGYHDGVNNRTGPYIFGANTSGQSGHYSAYLAFGTRANGSNPEERMRIDASGNVGIGTTLPSSGMQIKGDGKSLKVSSADYDIGFLGALGSGGTSVDKGYFYLKNTGTTKIQLHSDGDSYFNGGSVGIGETSPRKVLHVKGNEAGAQVVEIEQDNNAGIAGEIGRAS
jgi:hypothetical protein